jgi:8-oxo-dGTP diphosphatase
MKIEIPNCYYRISIKALILDETRTKFLIVQEENGEWDLPGGGLDWGESVEAGMRREIKEEMGLTVTSINQNPCYFLTDQRKSGAEYANVFYEVTVEDLNFIPSSECVALQFVTPEEVQLLNIHSNLRLLADMFDPRNHSRM